MWLVGLCLYKFCFCWHSKHDETFQFNMRHLPILLESNMWSNWTYKWHWMHSKCTIEENACIQFILSHVFIFITRFSHYTCITKCNQTPRSHTHIVWTKRVIWWPAFQTFWKIPFHLRRKIKMKKRRENNIIVHFKCIKLTSKQFLTSHKIYSNIIWNVQ